MDRLRLNLNIIPSKAPAHFPSKSNATATPSKATATSYVFVQLPAESHGYAAKENILQMLWEQHQWLRK